jgi:hypothetical protein
MTRIEIQDQIGFASKIVRQWPAWKQNILVHSCQPTNSVARSPVVNQHRHSISDVVAPDNSRDEQTLQADQGADHA